MGALDPPQRRQRTLDAVKRLLLRESQVQPLLVLFEDLHWIDAETQAFLDSLVESLPTARVLLLVNYRPEYEHALGEQDLLHPAPDRPSAARKRRGAAPAPCWGRTRASSRSSSCLIERTEGNPFFLEESVRTLVETEVLVGRTGAYRLTKALDGDADPGDGAGDPGRAHRPAAARGQAPAPDRRRSSGRTCRSPSFRRSPTCPRKSSVGGLAHLQAAEFLYETSLFPDLEYTFKHALTHEVAYGSLLQERRRALHARIVDAIEVLYPDRLAEHVERLAHHALRAERWDKASDISSGRARVQRERSAHRAAVDWLEQSLAALEHLPETRDTLACGLDVRLDLHAPFSPAEYTRMRRHMEAAEQVAVALGDQCRRGLALSLLCPALRVWRCAAISRGGRRALAIAIEIGDRHLEGEASLGLGQTYATLGDHRGAETFYRRNITPLPRISRPMAARAHSMVRAGPRSWLAYPLAELGRFDEGLALGTEALRIARPRKPSADRRTLHLGGFTCTGVPWRTAPRS